MSKEYVPLDWQPKDWNELFAKIDELFVHRIIPVYGAETPEKSLYAIHPAQVKILELASECNKKHNYLANMTFRDIADKVGLKHPQQAKHHIQQLIKKGLLKTTKVTL